MRPPWNIVVPAPVTRHALSDLLVRMGHFQKGRLLEARGDCFNSMAMFLQQKEEPVDGPARRGATRAWLADRAAQLQEKMPWGRNPDKTPEARAVLDEIDHQVLLRLHQRGYLGAVPQHVDTPGRHSEMVQRLNGRHQIRVSSDSQGLVENDGFNLEGANQRTLHRWLVLLHEAAHCEFAGVAQPFVPAQSRFSPAATALLQTWAFDGVHAMQSPHRHLLNEAFADTYAAVMLLEITGHSADAVHVVREQLGWRRAAREKAEAASRPGDTVALSGGYIGDMVLEKMLKRAPEWAGLPPEDMRQSVLEWASDGYQEWIDPARRENGAVSVEHLTMWQCDPARHLPAMKNAWMSGSDPLALLSAKSPGHPLLPVLAEMWEGVLPALEAAYPPARRIQVGAQLEALGDPASHQAAQSSAAVLSKALSSHSPGPRQRALLATLGDVRAALRADILAPSSLGQLGQEIRARQAARPVSDRASFSLAGP